MISIVLVAPIPEAPATIAPDAAAAAAVVECTEIEHSFHHLRISLTLISQTAAAGLLGLLVIDEQL